MIKKQAPSAVPPICMHCGKMWYPAPVDRDKPCKNCRKVAEKEANEVRGVKEDRPVCKKSGKVCYDRRSAIGAAISVRMNGRGTMRVYECPNCNKWHITKRL